MPDQPDPGPGLSAGFVLGMVPAAVAALLGLRLYGLLAPVPIPLLLGLIVACIGETILIDWWYTRSPSPARLQLRIAGQAVSTTVLIYVTGWGPALTIGYLFPVQETIAAAGSRAWRSIAWWCLGGLACGQAAIALGAAPTFIDQPGVHGLAVLAAIGLWMIFRLVGGNAAAKESAQAELTLSKHRFESLVQKSSDVICVMDRRFNVTYMSPSVTRLSGHPPEFYLGGNHPLAHPDDINRAIEAGVRLLGRPGASETVELRMSHADGEWRWVETTLTNLLDDPSVNGLVANFHDITEHRALAATLEFSAHHDSLTGLPNRRAFVAALDQALASGRRRGTTLAVLFCDLDRFKLINDSLGHAVGDQLLVTVAERLKAATRGDDLVARFAGDEFAILVREVSGPDDAIAVAERVLAGMRGATNVGGWTRQVSPSIGIALSHALGTPGDLLREADLAMYQAKENGRNSWYLFDAATERKVLEAVTLETELWHAAESDELVAFYQPEVDLATGAIVGVEALARWRHPRRGIVLPDAFIPLAEARDLAFSLDRVVLTSACRTVAGWRSRGLGAGLRVSVNLSPRWFRDDEAIGGLEGIVRRCGLEPVDVLFEITEHSALGDGDQPNLAVEVLRRAGFGIAIDDFGAGYSSMSYLSRFPIDALKLDRSLVALLDRSPRDAAIVRSMVSVGHAIGARVVAEGVERQAQIDLLRSFGVESAQGFWWSTAVPAGELEAMLDPVAPAPSAR